MSSDLYVIVGLGATGLSCAHFLKKNQIPFAVIDTRAEPPQIDAFRETFPEVNISLGSLDRKLLSEAHKIVLSPGISLQEPEIKEQAVRGVPIVGDIELFAQAVSTPVIAITGTNAKSTVTTLVGKMAEKAGYRVGVGGNLGTPALDLLMQQPNANLFVLELSSFQLETTYSLNAKVATVLNISPDHMDRYQDLTAYCDAKHRIYKHCDIAVCNLDDSLTYCQQPTNRTLFFTMNQPSTNEFGLITKSDVSYLAEGNHCILPVTDLPVAGKHYQMNALSALAIGAGFGFPKSAMIDVLKEFKGLPHRCQFVRERLGVGWYNDSKGTNVGATIAAILGLGSEINGKLILIAGGLGKNADFEPLVSVVKKYVRHVVLIGDAAPDLAAIFKDVVPTSYAKDMQGAVNQAALNAKAGDSVLLSPACASFDMFKSYAHRGDVFMEIVRLLPDENILCHSMPG